MKFARKITVTFSLIYLLGAALVTGYVYLSNLKILEAEILEKLEHQAANAIEKIDRMLYGGFFDIGVMAHDPVLRAPHSTPVQITEKLWEYRNLYRVYVSLSFFNMDRVRLADTTGKLLGRQDKPEYFWQEVAFGQAFALDFHQSETIGLPVFHFAHVVKDEDGIPRGVVVARMLLDELGRIVRQATVLHKREGVVKVHLVDRDGRMLYACEGEAVILKGICPDWKYIAGRLAQGEKMGHGRMTRRDGEALYFFIKEPGCRDYNGNDWTLVMEVPAGEAFAAADALRRKMILILGGMGVISLLGIFVFARRLARPLADLNRAAAQISRGHLEVELPVASQDEIGALAASFNEMARRLQESRQELLTAQAQVEGLYHRADEQLSVMLESLPVVVYTCRADGDYAVIYMSANVAQVTGFTAEEFIARPSLWTERLHPEDVGRVLAELPKINETGLFELEYRWQIANGFYRWFYDSLRLIKSPAGEPLRFTGIWLDITRRRETQEALRESEERYRTVVDNIGVGVVLISPAMEVLALNRQTRAWFPAIDPALQPICYRAFNHPPRDAPCSYCPTIKTLQDGLVHEAVTDTPAGEEIRHYKIVASPLKDRSGQVVAAIEMVEDITEHRRLEAALVQAKEDLEAKVAERTVALREANLRLTAWAMEMEDRHREVSLLGKMGDLLQSCRVVEEAYQIIGQSLRQLFPGDSGGLYVYSASRNLVEGVALWGEAPGPERAFAPDDCWALRRGQAHGPTELQSGLRCRHVEEGAGDYLCVPLTALGEAMGVLHLYWGEAPSAPEAERRLEARQQLALSVAEHLALSLANLRLNEAMRELSIRDPLTGLFNRRFMEESLERELHRAMRQDAPLGAIMLDLDHFKNFNDTFGHEAGDALLREVGVLFQRTIRAGDIPCRYGGEEFLLILPETSLDAACRRAEDLREAVGQLRVLHNYRSLGPVTISAGVAVFPEHGETAAALMQAADAALYRAKQEGRDRICVAGTA